MIFDSKSFTCKVYLYKDIGALGKVRSDNSFFVYNKDRETASFYREMIHQGIQRNQHNGVIESIAISTEALTEMIRELNRKLDSLCKTTPKIKISFYNVLL